MSDKRCVPKYRTIGQQNEIENNRKKYPEIAEWVDHIRKHFPEAKVVGIYKKGYFRLNSGRKERK